MSNETQQPRPVEILLVEDNPGDIDLTLEALEEARIRNTVAVVEDGVEALRYLRREGEYSGVQRPDLILLDLNLPKKDGRAVLDEIKAEPSLRRIPVVVLTTSDSEKDVLESYDRHAAAYIVKPVDFGQFADVVRSIEGFWLTVVQYAPGD